MKTFIILTVLAFASAVEVDWRVVSGSNAPSGAWPHQLSLRAPSSHNCGAVIVSATKGVTAAHCVTGSSYTIRAGTTTRSSCSGNCQDRTVTTFTLHPLYNVGPGAFPNDVATLYWSALSFNAEIQSRPLNSANNDGSGCTITGWGRTCGSCGLPENLQQAAVPTLSNAQCASYWGGNVNDGHICIFNGVVGACNGDSGGPLTCSGSTYGLASWVASGCNVAMPSAYTRVSYFFQWINQN